MKWAYVAGIVILAAVGAAAFYAPSVGLQATYNQGLTWGPTQSARVIQVIPRGDDVTYGILESSGAIGAVTTIGPCNHLSVDDTVYYRVSSIDPSLGTQRAQIVNPAGCTTTVNH